MSHYGPEHDVFIYLNDDINRTYNIVVPDMKLVNWIESDNTFVSTSRVIRKKLPIHVIKTWRDAHKVINDCYHCTAMSRNEALYQIYRWLKHDPEFYAYLNTPIAVEYIFIFGLLLLFCWILVVDPYAEL